MNRPLLAVGAVAASAVVLAACGSSGSSYGARPVHSSSAPPAGPGPSVGLGHTSSGSVLVDSNGRTLYLFSSDTPAKSTCDGPCSRAWPAATVTGMPTAGSGLTASMLATITRSDGSKQLEYNGHPLYRFIQDTAPGQMNGEGSTAYGASWWVLDAAGNQK